MTGGDTISVLCVDDEPGLAELVGTHLERADERLTSVAVTSAAAAFDALDTMGIDCVVSDYEMPGTDGIELLEAIRADDPGLPFVLFTGRGSEELASRAISAGVTDYLRKARGAEQYALLARRVVHAVERVRARRAADAAEERRRLILEGSPDSIVVIVDGAIAYANPPAVATAGVEDESGLVGRSVDAFASGGTRESVLRAIEHAASGDERRARVTRPFETPDGRQLTMEATGRRLTWDGADGVVAVLRDVTDREARDEGRARYRAAFEEAATAMVIADDDGRYVEVNAAACELFDVPRAELVGSRVNDFAAPGYDVEGEWMSFRESEIVHGTFPLVRSDGEERIVEYGATANVAPGEHLSVLHDVTERVDLGERLEREQAALEEMYRITADGEASFDEKVERLLDLGRDYLDVPGGYFMQIDEGHQRVVTAVGDDDISPGETCPLEEAYCKRTMTHGELVTVQNATREGWADDPAYERFGFGCYIGAKVTVGGDLYGTFCFAGSDPRTEPFGDAERTFVELMARWVSYELERRRTTDRLAEQNERLERFASVVSHDLRSPLSVARGYLALAREGDDPEAFDRVEAAHERMETIIADLLTLTREGEELGSVKSVDLDALVASSWDLAVGEEADATLDVAGPLGTVAADDERLRHLLENLFRNALEHAADGALTVTVGTTDDGFYVADDGPGIPADRREEIFEDGFTTRQDGTGLGLSIVEQIADAHGWDVAVSEGERGGARFEIDGVSGADEATASDADGGGGDATDTDDDAGDAPRRTRE
ncbi:PAS domain S-box protein [Halarchaeum nitratireducens]|uniref:histidine kinase n=1 Tax=Halarchaeum nitratireducens TaxID=489913 RepID=A0A830GCL7_9EURY|nr:MULTISPECIES: PAS domain S-box protein [Halarchaeum]MBP2252179.1 PAS domain S-box-containing protein [Halarchaeum solikamskense]GGN18481.1 ATPase [Halarchaeum nitratireducens]